MYLWQEFGKQFVVLHGENDCRAGISSPGAMKAGHVNYTNMCLILFEPSKVPNKPAAYYVSTTASNVTDRAEAPMAAQPVRVVGRLYCTVSAHVCTTLSFAKCDLQNISHQEHIVTSCQHCVLEGRALHR